MFSINRIEVFKKTLNLDNKQKNVVELILKELELTYKEYVELSDEDFLDLMFSYVHNRGTYIAS